MNRELFDYLETYLTEPRKARLREVLALRTRHIAVVLDSIYQPHNTSAALRSCEAFGLQEVFLVERLHEQQLSQDVAAGTDKWLTLHRHQGPTGALECIAELRRRQFRIVVSTPGQSTATPETLDLSTPLALVIGNETTGVTAEFLDAADERLTIPMCGFVDSFNLSVACALCLQDLTRRLRVSAIDWRLSPAEHEELLFEWTRASVANVAAIEERWRRDRSGAEESLQPDPCG